MKKLSVLILSIFSIVTLTSCDNDELGPVANTSDPEAPSITSPESGESYTLSQDQEDETFLTIEWSEPDFGFAAAPTYTIEMDEQGNEFEEPIEIVSVQSTSHSLVVGDFNNRLISEGFQGDQSHSLEIRVIASISDSVSEAVSDPVAVSFTPYTVEVEYPEIYVPGSYQSASGYGNDWTPEDAPPLFSVNDDDNYEGYVYMANTDNQFKYTPERNWNEDWGDTGGDGTLDFQGDNIELSNSGYYKMNVDLNNMTYETLNTTWGIIGSATADGWDADQDMTYDSDAKVWTITTDLTAEEMKFRANDAWDLNYGDTEADGTLEQDGDNIVIDEAGNYTVTLDLSEAPYTYSLEKN